MKRNLLTLLIFLAAPAIASAGTYPLEIGRKDVSINGRTTQKIAVNGSIPGPTLAFSEDEAVEVPVTNHLDVATSIHWHGLLVPAAMDGVPGMNGFAGIQPGETFVYRFKIRQSGTYWYHSHSLGQEQDGLYGSIVIKPKTDPIKADRDYVVLLSELSDENSNQILRNLKLDSGYYNHSQQTFGDFINQLRESGLGTSWRDAAAWGEMRMSKTDLSDVSGYRFLMNGLTAEENWTGLFKSGERVRLRFINSSAMTIYDVRIPGLKMTVVQADGQNVEPVVVDEFRFGVAETYDVVVEPQDRPYSIIAEPIDRTGFAVGTLAAGAGQRGEIPPHRERALLTMADMGMMDRQMDHGGMDHQMAMDDSAGGWGGGTPCGEKALSYDDLKYLGKQGDLRPPGREIVLELGGNMERYIWTINGKKHEQSEPFFLNLGERLRLKFINGTMMAHPMHLHGMFLQIENGQPPEKRPNKHTIIVPPGKTITALLTADEPGEWPIHCHLLYHMLSGMMGSVVVSEQGREQTPEQYRKQHPHDH